MMGENQVVHHSHKGLQLSKVCGEVMSVMALILRLSALSPSGIHISPKKDVWSTLNWNLSGLNCTLLSYAVSRTLSMC